MGNRFGRKKKKALKTQIALLQTQKEALKMQMRDRAEQHNEFVQSIVGDGVDITIRPSEIPPHPEFLETRIHINDIGFRQMLSMQQVEHIKRELSAYIFLMLDRVFEKAFKPLIKEDKNNDAQRYIIGIDWDGKFKAWENTARGDK